MRRKSSSKPPVVTSFQVSGVKNGSGFSARARLSPSAAAVGGDVEQQRRHAGVGEVRGNLGAHRAGAENRNRANHLSSLTRLKAQRANHK